MCASPRRAFDWLRYEVPGALHPPKGCRSHYRGQKQIWFLLRLVGRDSDMNLRATDHPEFDAWRWNDYWVPLDLVIEFKREVYQMALSELAFPAPGQSAQPASCAADRGPAALDEHHAEPAPAPVAAAVAPAEGEPPGCRLALRPGQHQRHPHQLVELGLEAVDHPLRVRAQRGIGDQARTGTPPP